MDAETVREACRCLLELIVLWERNQDETLDVRTDRLMLFGVRNSAGNHARTHADTPVGTHWPLH